MLKVAQQSKIDFTETSKNLVDKKSPERVVDKYHVFEYDGNLMCCTLNQTDISDNSNKFFIMQLLKNDKANSYIIFTRGGRVGYTGQSNCSLYAYFEDALKDYNSLFKSKTGKTWKDRNSKVSIEESLVDDEIRYEFIEMKYQDKSNSNELSNKLKGKIDEIKKTNEHKIPDIHVQQLVELIYDPKLYKKTMSQLRIDSKRLPLGKLSKQQIGRAYEILAYISDNLEKLDSKKFTKLSSQYYTIIPYASGIDSPPIIDSSDKITEKIEQLKILDDMVVAAKKLVNPKLEGLNEKYLSLNCGLSTVSSDHEVNMIINYVKNTSASTHYFKIKVKNIFKINRKLDDEHFSKFQNFENRQLLWHGSGLANYVSILSNGLRINPKNVVKTGSMFGNGIYFSNTASKSAQYIRTNQNGLMLLCEVALGKTYNLTSSKYVTKLPDGTYSTYGQGNKTPDPTKQIILNDGLIVPSGPLINRSTSSSLRYDEFIVYDINQIKFKYLVQVDLV